MTDISYRGKAASPNLQQTVGAAASSDDDRRV